MQYFKKFPDALRHAVQSLCFEQKAPSLGRALREDKLSCELLVASCVSQSDLGCAEQDEGRGLSPPWGQSTGERECVCVVG